MARCAVPQMAERDSNYIITVYCFVRIRWQVDSRMFVCFLGTPKNQGEKEK